MSGCRQVFPGWSSVPEAGGLDGGSHTNRASNRTVKMLKILRTCGPPFFLIQRMPSNGGDWPKGHLNQPVRQGYCQATTVSLVALQVIRGVVPKTSGNQNR
jgi:hypothetical protein